MRGLSRLLIVVVIIATAFKICLILLIPFTGDFVNWVNGARSSFLLFSEAELPRPNAYAGLMSVLAPFYWLWTILPVPHPSISEMVGHYSTPELVLVFLMKLPTLTFDAASGILLYILVRERTGLERNGWVAFLVWYLNPYNWFWIYYYGGFDVIPIALILLAVFYGNRGRWLRCGFCASIAAILRLFPLLLFPFLIFYAAKQGLRPTARLLVSLLLPLAVVFAGVAYALGSFGSGLSAFLDIPMIQPYLEDFWGFPLDGANVYFRLTPFLLLLQLYIILRYWRDNPSWLEDILGASLLVMLVSQPQGNAHHFLWVSPFLSAYYALGRIKRKLLAGVYVAAALFPPWFDTPQRLLSLQIEPFFGGLFVGIKAITLLKLNSQSMRVRPRMESVLRYLFRFPNLPRPNSSVTDTL